MGMVDGVIDGLPRSSRSLMSKDQHPLGMLLTGWLILHESCQATAVRMQRPLLTLK